MTTGEGITIDHPRLEAHTVVDANVVAKWFADEDLTIQAREVMRSRDVLLAPDFLPAEVGSIFRKKILSGEMTGQIASDALPVFLDRLTLVPCRALFDQALNLGVSTGRSFYDSLYVALAMTLDTRLVTADERLINALRSTHGGWLMWLGDV